jgi:hypothetical protein
MVQPNGIVFWNFQTISFFGNFNFFFEVRGHFDVFLTRSSHNKGPTTDWIVHFYCPKVPLSIGTTLGALGSVVPKSVFHTRGSNHPITPNPALFFSRSSCLVRLAICSVARWVRLATSSLNAFAAANSVVATPL